MSIQQRLQRVHDHTRLTDRLVGLLMLPEGALNLDLLKVAIDEAAAVSGGLEDVRQAMLEERRKKLGPDGGK